MHVGSPNGPPDRKAVEWGFAGPGSRPMPRPHRSFVAAVSAIVVAALLLPAPGAEAPNELVSVIVREQAAAGDAAERLVAAHGGRVGRALPIIDGFAAEVPGGTLAALEASPAIVAITPNAPLQLTGHIFTNAATEDVTPFDPGSLRRTARIIGADQFWAHGLTGSGVDVAIVDSGVSPVFGLDAAGKVVRGPDLSFESQAPNLRYLDTFGHGTFMAGLIAGRDAGINIQASVPGTYAGIAPDARIVSVKVADSHGATDVSQVIAAIDWVVQHRRTNGLNIRVLNLSFGTVNSQPYALDPLAFAAEVAWHAGIFVVVAGGNSSTAAGRLMNPAIDPFVMAVGASSPNGTLSTSDDFVLASSARGDGVRNPDVVAPGHSVHGLRVPGSFIDLTFPTARIGDRFFRGTGTSQAAAVVSGAAALVIQQRPSITPDALKALLTRTANPLTGADARAQGAGLVDLHEARRTATPLLAAQPWLRATGAGSLELARGASHLVVDGVPLNGERDIFGRPFESVSMAGATLAHATWSGGTWNGSVWTGPGWVGSEWPTVPWTGTSWSGNEWSSYNWSANEWSANEWSGGGWNASEWSASEWSASEWSASEWSGSEWSTSGWQTGEWSSTP